MCYTLLLKKEPKTNIFGTALHMQRILSKFEPPNPVGRRRYQDIKFC